MGDEYSLGGRILTVDLSRRQVTLEPTRPYSQRLMGGLGINILKMLELTPVSAGALDAGNPLLIGAGTLVGTLAPTACRVCVNSKNPFSGGFGSASAGGFFTAAMKYAGIDNIVVRGRADRPVYLLIQDDRVSIEDAASLWGSTTWETEAALRRKTNTPDLEILSIGPAGENQVGAANVVVSRSRSASRCGLGAVMGSKHLKAVAVRGTGGIEVADPEGFMEACRDMSRRIVKADTTVNLRKFGTPTSFARWNEQSALPTLNFQQTQMDLDKAARLHAGIFKEKHIVRNFGCFACPLHCSQFTQIHEGPHAGTPGEKIECQNLWDFGTKLGFTDLAAVIQASALCFELGLDINNATGAISWAFECFQRGILTEEDTDGLRLEWGDAEVVLALLRKMARREGFGALLARGSREAARIVGKGAEKYAIHVRGQELAEELRAFKGWALGITVAERGGAHTTGAPLTERMAIDEALSQELFGVTTASQPDTYTGKAGLVVYYQRFHAVLETLGVCFFSSNWMGPHMARPGDYATLVSLATGRPIDEAALMTLGEKIHTLCKLYNLKHAGGERSDDYPPERLMREPTTGSEPGKTLDRQAWSRMLDEYYELHGWDVATGRPTRERLIELGLEDFMP